MVHTVVMQLRYQGGPRGLHVLVDSLKAEGLTVNYYPIETRSATQTALEVVIHIAHGLSSNAEDAVYTGALLAAAKRAIAKARERFPDLPVEIEDDDESP